MPSQHHKIPVTSCTSQDDPTDDAGGLPGEPVSAPIELPACEGPQTIEFCATLALLRAPAPTCFGWLWRLSEFFAWLCQPTPLRALVVPEVRIGNPGIAIKPPAWKQPIASGETVSLALVIPAPAPAPAIPAAPPPCGAYYASRTPPRALGCDCPFCRGFFLGVKSSTKHAIDSHRLSISRN